MKTISERLAAQKRLARKLVAYKVGEWVAVKGDEVVAHASTLEALLRKIESRKVDRVFQLHKGPFKLAKAVPLVQVAIGARQSR